MVSFGDSFGVGDSWPFDENSQRFSQSDELMFNKSGSQPSSDPELLTPPTPKPCENQIIGLTSLNNSQALDLELANSQILQFNSEDLLLNDLLLKIDSDPDKSLGNIDVRGIKKLWNGQESDSEPFDRPDLEDRNSGPSEQGALVPAPVATLIPVENLVIAKLENADPLKDIETDADDRRTLQLAIEYEPLDTAAIVNAMFPDLENVVFEDWPGPLNFKVTPTATDKCLYSEKFNKLYCKMGAHIPFKVEMDFAKVPPQPIEKWKLRAYVAFEASDLIDTPVKRCRKHEEEESKIAEEGEPKKRLKHVLRVTGVKCEEYYENPKSERCYVVTPMAFPAQGTDSVTRMYTFGCQNTCLDQSSRQAPNTSIIFTLFNENCQIIGRSSCKVRVCTAPKRDFNLDEARDAKARDVKGTKRKNTDDDHQADSSNVNMVKAEPQPCTSTSVVPVIRNSVTAPIDDDTVSSSQDSQEIYVDFEPSKRLRLRVMVRKTKKTLDLMQSEDPMAQSIARSAYSVLRMLSEVNAQAEVYEQSKSDQQQANADDDNAVEDY